MNLHYEVDPFVPLTSRQWVVALWLDSARFRGFVRGLPALVAGVAVLFTVVQVRLTSDEDIVARYRTEAEEQARVAHHDEALVCNERLASMRPDTPEFVFQQALTLDALGEHDRALDLAARIAPAFRRGYAPAHLWAAERLSRSPRPTAKTLNEVESHLRLYLQATAKPEPRAHELLGQLYWATGRPAEAEAQYSKIVGERPTLLLPLALACQAQGEKLAATDWAERAQKYFLAQLKTDPNNQDARLEAAAALLLLERYPEVETLLLQGLSRRPDSRYHESLAQLYVAWSATLRKNNEPVSAQLALLEKGLTQDPSNRILIDRMLEILQSKGPQAEEARSLLTAALAKGDKTAVVHFALGIDAWNRGKALEARTHWETARTLKPEMPGVLNNLAWILAFGPDPDLEHALKLINEAIQRWPNVVEFLDTRGQILVKLERWREALPDLEAALRANPELPGLHLALGTAYEHLGLHDLAAEHRRQAKGAAPSDAKPTPK